MKGLNIMKSKIDCHFVREKVLSKEIITDSVSSNDQLINIFRKSSRGPPKSLYLLQASCIWLISYMFQLEGSGENSDSECYILLHIYYKLGAYDL